MERTQYSWMQRGSDWTRRRMVGRYGNFGADEIERGMGDGKLV